MQAYLRETPRFMSEYGLQAWPSVATVDQIATRAEQRIDSPVIRAHQKFMAGEGNSRLLHYIELGYGTPKDFEDFVYLSQVMQADGIALAALHHQLRGRTRWARCTGSSTMSGRVLHGPAWTTSVAGRRCTSPRGFFAPVTVAALRDEGSTRVRLINDGAALDARWRLRVMDVEGKVLRRREDAVTLAASGVTSIGDFRDAELLAGADPKRTVAVFELLQNGAVSARQVVGFVEAKDQMLPRQKLKATLSIEGDHYRLRLESAAYVRAAWIDFGALDVQVEDNLLDLLPGEIRDIAVRGPVDLTTLREALKVKTLNDR